MHKTHMNSGKRCAAKTPALGGERTSWPHTFNRLWQAGTRRQHGG